MDDDVELATAPLARLLRFVETQRDVVACRVYENGQVVRNPESRWFLSRAEYSPTSLGTYCQVARLQQAAA